MKSILFIRGMLGRFATKGLDEIYEEVDTSYHKEICNHFPFRSALPYYDIIVGHSMGANKAIRACQKLNVKYSKFPNVKKLILFDPAFLWSNDGFVPQSYAIPKNVLNCYNYISNDFRARKVMASTYGSVLIHNRMKDLNHIEIVENKDIQKEVLKLING